MVVDEEHLYPVYEAFNALPAVLTTSPEVARVVEKLRVFLEDNYKPVSHPVFHAHAPNVTPEMSPEISTIAFVIDTFGKLDADARQRVIDYATRLSRDLTMKGKVTRDDRRDPITVRSRGTSPIVEPGDAT